MAGTKPVNQVEPFLVIFIAHLIGDFVLQTEQMALKKPHVFGWLLWHSFQLGAITWLCCWTSSSPVIGVVLIVFFTHLVFDWVKPRLPGSPLGWYIMDQLAHTIVLWVCAAWMAEKMAMSSMPLTNLLGLNQGHSFGLKAQIIISAYLLVGRPLTVGLGLFLKPWQDELLKTKTDNSGADCATTGLTRSGEWIGNIERFFVLTCVLVGQYMLVGALLIAKAIMRYGEVSQVGQRKRGDYVIIGTLGSFALAIIVGLLAHLTVNLL